MFTSLISLLGSSAIGSLVGGIFAFLNRKTDITVKQLELSHEKDKWEYELKVRDSDLAIAREEAKAKQEVAVIEGNAAFDVERMKAIAAVQAAERVTAEEIKAAGKLGWLFVMASVFNKLIRPVLTVILAIAAIYLNWLVIDRLIFSWPTMSQVQQYEAGMQAFAWVTAQASMAFAYWFVSRGTGK